MFLISTTDGFNYNISNFYVFASDFSVSFINLIYNNPNLNTEPVIKLDINANINNAFNLGIFQDVTNYILTSAVCATFSYSLGDTDNNICFSKEYFKNLLNPCPICPTCPICPICPVCPVCPASHDIWFWIAIAILSIIIIILIVILIISSSNKNKNK